jgi:hypothetical protein
MIFTVSGSELHGYRYYAIDPKPIHRAARKVHFADILNDCDYRS